MDKVQFLPSPIEKRGPGIKKVLPSPIERRGPGIKKVLPSPLRGRGAGGEGASRAQPSCSSGGRRRTNVCPQRTAFTILEATVVLALVAVLAAIVAQAMVWSLRERARLTSHQAATELAANVLEEARAQPWEKLDATWAEGQTVPSEMAALLPEGKIHVTLEPGAKTRRVTVEVRWQLEQDQRVKLTTLLSSREAKKTGGTP